MGEYAGASAGQTAAVLNTIGGIGFDVAAEKALIHVTNPAKTKMIALPLFRMSTCNSRRIDAMRAMLAFMTLSLCRIKAAWAKKQRLRDGNARAF
jgi:hypothetical protein